MSLIATGYLATEGTLILCREKDEQLGLTREEKALAASLEEKLSVVKAGMTAAENGACAMHDVTEGGLYGAAYEMALSSGCGVEVWPERAKVLPLTRKVADALGIDIFRLIGSGSLLIACRDAKTMLRALEEAGCEAAEIGRLTPEGFRIVRGGTAFPLDPPGADELYRALET